MPIERFTGWYKRYERQVSSFALLGGFVFDAFTLRNVDALWENFWIILHLVIVGVAILILNRQKEGEEGGLDFWMLNLLQFSYGGLLSAFLIFYFRGATLAVSWPFLLILVAVFIMNELLKKHYQRLTLQVSLFFFSLFLFAIFAVPVLVGSMGAWVFILSGVASLFILRLFVRILEKYSKDRFLYSRSTLRFSIVGIFLGMNLLYFTNIIPPLPLSLRDGGVYRLVTRSVTGDYIFDSGPRNWFDYFSLYPTVHVEGGEPLYAYTAIFSPASFSVSIIHEWEIYNETEEKWVGMSQVVLAIAGGRKDGYRTYSVSSVTAGKWRVSVRTPSGQVVGRLNFKVVL